MSFRNLPPDLVLPPNGSLIPGSNTVYIGSKRLPSELVANGFTSAIVFYSSPTGLANGIKYWFLAKQTDTLSNEAVRIGSVNTSGTVASMLWTGIGPSAGSTFVYIQTPGGLSNRSLRLFDGASPFAELRCLDGDLRILGHASSAAHPIVIDAKEIDEWADLVQVHLRNSGTWNIVDGANSALSSVRFSGIGTGTERLQADQGSLGTVELVVESEGSMRLGSGTQDIHIWSDYSVGHQALSFLGLGTTKPYIKGDPTNTILDQWSTSSVLQTIGGVANCSVKFDWRITPDYVMDVRFFINCPAAIGVGAGAVNLALPAAFPTVDLSPGISRGGFTPVVGEGGAGFFPMMMRFNNGGTCDLFTCLNPNNNTVFEGGGAFTLLKP